MDSYNRIERKLNRFIRKYYINELIRGSILFVAAGLFYLLVVAGVEHFFWLDSTGRLILFWTFIGVEVALLAKFIILPLARLFRLSRGLDYRDAGHMIGKHFPEVSDKLVNILQLHETKGDDELTWASIEQKSHELEPIPFSMAIDFKANARYLGYLAVPVVFIFILIITGYNKAFTESASRVADYSTDYEPPAPFKFQVSGDLSTLEGQNYTVEVTTVGNVVPQRTSIAYNGQRYYMNQIAPGRFSYTFQQPRKDLEFTLDANNITSDPYYLRVGEVPVIKTFQMKLDFPGHIGRADETLSNTGNTTIPEGTKITWELTTRTTDSVHLIAEGERMDFERDGSFFAFAKAIKNPLQYSISTSNQNSRDHEQLSYKIDVVKDEFPEIKVEMKRDSIAERTMHFRGQVADDYGISKARIVYYNADTGSDKQVFRLKGISGNFDEFLFTFPGPLELKEGTEYEFYFEAVDNDAVNNFKTARTETFSFKKLTAEQENQKQLQNQQQTLQNLEKSLQIQKQRKKELEQLSQEQMEKNNRSFNEKRKLDNFLKRQQEQKRQMRQQMRKLQHQLENTPEEEKATKEELEERIKKSEEELKREEELLKELREYQEKLSPQELQDKMEQMKRQSQKQERNLEQLLELTKRFYVTQKFELLGKELDKLGDKQLQQSDEEGKDNEVQEQEKLNEEFNKWKEEMDDLLNENKQLKKPMSLEMEKETSEDIQEDQQEATEELKQQQQKSAQQKQKSAGEKMKEQAAKMQKQMQAAMMNSMQEDKESLRQILDNLIIFSKEQEGLLDIVKGLNRNSPNFGETLTQQKKLEEAFKHVDDSLFALSQRNKFIKEKINKEIIDISYYLDKSMEQMAEFQMNESQVSQQYVITGANNLANMLSNTMDAMENAMSMPGVGKGKSGSGFQLPDIIKKQKSLSEGQSGEEGKPGSKGQGQQPGEKGSSSKPGQGKQGSQGQQGSGQQGKSQGKSGQGGQSGNGEGQSGQGDGEEGNGDSGQNGQNGQTNGEGRGTSYKQSEKSSAKLYQIYKQQQDLRNQLEDRIRKAGLEGKVNNITERMKAIEHRLLDQGYDRKTQDMMKNIHQELMKLRDATLKQGEEEKRESNTNKKQFGNYTEEDLPDASKYFNNKEILNRQALPLQPYYKKKVKEYFKQR